MTQPLGSRHAVVTGASRGIGAAIATELARRGADVSLLARSVDEVEARATELAANFGVRAVGIGCDVGRAEEITSAFADARHALGEIHVLVNNAGWAHALSVAEMTVDVWEQTMRVNVTGTLLCIQQVLPAMLAAQSGRIVNVASTAALRGYSRMSAYSASKHAVLGLTRSLAAETAKRGITVNAVCPGYTDTEMAAMAASNLVAARGMSPEDARAAIARTNARGTLITAEEVAFTVGWLCSPEASGISGSAIVVAGGDVP